MYFSADQQAMYFSADDAYILGMSTAHRAGQVTLWDINMKGAARVVAMTEGYVNSARLAPNDEYILSVGGDGKLQVFDFRNKVCVCVYVMYVCIS